MADTKRNSIAGRVATPKPANSGSGAASPAPPTVDTLEALGKALGARLKLTTAAPSAQTYEGTLYTACPLLNVVILNVRPASPSADPSTQPGDYRTIPMSRVQSFQVLSPAPGAQGGDASTASALAPVGPVDTRRLKERERARVEQLKDEARNQGRGVTREAQAIYDSFRRINTPIRWHNQEMVVHEAVIIAPPYRAEDCRGPKDKQEVLGRVRKVLEGEKRKLKEREERERKGGAGTPPVGGVRKGG